MNHTFFYSLILITFLIFFTGCDDPRTTDPTPLAAVTQSPAQTSLPPTIPPATATAEPFPTNGPTNSPPPSVTSSPMPTASPAATKIPQAVDPTPSAEPKLEWVLPTEQPANLLSISGGILHGFAVRDDYVYASLGATLAVIDMGESPAGLELNRISLQGGFSSSAMNNRFMFAAIGDVISIIDLQDPVDIKEVARIKGLSKGTLYTGRNNEVFFEDSDSNWWELDVDQVLPAIWLEDFNPDFKSEARKAHEQNQDTFLNNISSIQEQMEEVFTWIGFSYPIESHATGSDLFVGVHSGSEWGGGQLVRLKTDVSNGPELYSTFRTFTPIKLDYENGRVFAGYAFETASELSIISVEDIESPIYENSIYIHSNAFKSIDNQLYIGARGLSQMNGDQNFELRAQAKPIDGKTDYLNQLIFDEERALIYGLRGAQNPSGLAIYSIADPTAPQFISALDINGPFQITYLQNKIYGFRSGYNDTNPELLVIDVTDPLMPELEGILELDDRVIGVHAWLGQSNKSLLALLTARTGLRIWEMADPAQPVELISIEYPDHCKMPENDPRYEIPFSRQLFFLNEHLVSPIGICGNFKIDVSSPTSAQIIGPFPYSGAVMFEDGYLFTGGTNLKIYQLDEQEQ